MYWPESLIEELAFRRVVIFLGSGISSSAKDDDGESPPSWKKLLESAMGRFVSPDEHSFVSQLLSKELFLDAAEVIFANVGQADRRIFFRDIFATPAYKPSALHSIIQEVDAKIVLTTNYDQLYEKQCGALMAGQGYSVRTYNDNKLLNDVRSKDNLIIKAHGCVNRTEHIVLTRSDYFEIRRDHSYFYNILNSLLTVNTVLFLGCSMTDPDIQLILENTNIAAYSDHPHYLVLPEGSRHPTLIKALEKTFNLKVLQYPNGEGDHRNLEIGLRDLKDSVEKVRARSVRPS